MNTTTNVTFNSENNIFTIQYPNSNVYVRYSEHYNQFVIWGGTPDKNGKLELPTSFSYNGSTHYVTTIGRNAFFECEELRNIVIPETYTTICATAFRGSGLTKLILPKSIRTLGYSMCSRCNDLEYVWIQNPRSYYNYSDGSIHDIYDLPVPMQSSRLVSSHEYQMSSRHRKDRLFATDRTHIYIGPDKEEVANKELKTFKKNKSNNH